MILLLSLFYMLSVDHIAVLSLLFLGASQIFNIVVFSGNQRRIFIVTFQAKYVSSPAIERKWLLS